MLIVNDLIRLPSTSSLAFGGVDGAGAAMEAGEGRRAMTWKQKDHNDNKNLETP